MEWLNNFYMTIFDFQISNAVVIAGFTYGLLVVMLIIAALNLDVKLFSWIGLVQVVFNLIFCIGYLPEHYLLITKVFIFLLPYTVATVFILYRDFLEKKKDA